MSEKSLPDLSPCSAPKSGHAAPPELATGVSGYDYEPSCFKLEGDPLAPTIHGQIGTASSGDSVITVFIDSDGGVLPKDSYIPVKCC